MTSTSPDELQDVLEAGGIDPRELEGLPAEVQDAVAEDVEAVNREFAEFEDEVTEQGLPAEQWFEASTGLATVQKLLDVVRATPDHFEQADLLIKDLEDVERILEMAAKQGCRFHFSVDF